MACLGPADGVEGQPVDPGPPLERGELVAPRREPLGLAGDLLGIDRVLLDPGTGAGLVVAGALQGALLVADLDLEPLAGAGLLGDRAERLEGPGLLLDLQRRGVAEGGQRLDRRLADEALELRPQRARSPGRARPRGRAGLSRRRKIGQADRSELAGQVGLLAPEVLLQLGPTAEPPRDLVVAELLLAAQVEGGASPAPGIEGEQPREDRRAEPADRDVDRQRRDEADHGGGEPADGEDEAQPGDRLVARLGNDDLVVDRRRLVARAAARSSPISRSRPRSRSTIWRRTGSACGDGWLVSRVGDLVARRDGLAVALEALPGNLALRDEPLGLAGLLEERAALGERRLHLGPALAGEDEPVPVALEAGRAADSPSATIRAVRVTASSATRSRPGFFSPRVCRSRSAFSSFRFTALVPRSAPLIDAWSRSRRAPSSRARSSTSWWRTEAVERKNFSPGMPVRSARISSTRAGSVMVSPSISSRTVALPPRKSFSSDAPPRTLEVLLDELKADPRPAVIARAPGAERVDLRPAGRDLPEEGELERPLEGRLARLVGPADDRQPRGELEVEVPVTCRSRRRRRVILTASPRGRRAGGGPGGAPRAARRASPSRPAASSSAISALEVPDERPGDRVGRRQRAVRERRRGRVADPDAEEPVRELALHLVRREVEVVGPDADEPDVEDEVRVGQRREPRDERRLAGHRARRRPPGARSASGRPAAPRRSRAAAAALLERDEEDVACPVLVDGDRLRARRCRPRPSPPPGRAASSASGRGRGSRGRRGDRLGA